jgi:hypothetical protein
MGRDALMAEFLARGDELANGHVLRSPPGLTSAVENLPCLAEVVVEVVHVLGHSVVLAEFRRRELR